MTAGSGRGGGNSGGLGQALRVPEFRALWAAEIVSVGGDQLARVGLSVLVFGRTGSAAWAAATYALTFLPALVGGVLLGRLADRHPRRRVMLVCDLLRALLVALMVLPGAPLPVLCALLVAVVLLAPLHTAAQGALLPEVVPGRVFEAALAVRHVTGQAAQVAGFAVGGLLVATLSPAAALALDAASFVVSALVVRLGVAERPVSDAAAAPAPVPWWVDARTGLRTVLGDDRRRVLACAAWLVGCFVLPEGLAVPYAGQLGLDTAAAGLLMAADPAGSVVGAWLFTRFVPERVRRRAIGPLAVAAALPLGRPSRGGSTPARACGRCWATGVGASSSARPGSWAVSCCRRGSPCRTPANSGSTPPPRACSWRPIPPAAWWARGCSPASSPSGCGAARSAPSRWPPPCRSGSAARHPASAPHWFCGGCRAPVRRPVWSRLSPSSSV